MLKKYYDYATRNKSFMDMHKYLKSIEVKNNRFMLTIYDISLIGLDPYDPNLTVHEKRNIVNECSINIWYFLREIVRIPLPGGDYTLFKLDRSNCAQVYNALLTINSWITKPRGLIKTISTLCLINYARMFGRVAPPNNIGLYSYSITDSKQLETKLQSLTNILPDYIREKFGNNYQNINSHSLLPESPEDIKAFGENFNNAIMYCSDAEYIKKIFPLYMHCVDAYNELCKTYRTTGVMSAMLFESVISDDTTAHTLLKKAVHWVDVFYDVDVTTLQKMISDNPVQLMHVYTGYKDLGLGDDWFQEQCKLLCHDPVAIRREILLERKNNQ